MDTLERFSRTIGFEWDNGNTEKSWLKHHVTPSECEQVFFNPPLIVVPDLGQEESRCYLLGQTDAVRLLFIVFILRGPLIQVISARDMNGEERKAYETP